MNWHDLRKKDTDYNSDNSDSNRNSCDVSSHNLCFWSNIFHRLVYLGRRVAFFALYMLISFVKFERCFVFSSFKAAHIGDREPADQCQLVWVPEIKTRADSSSSSLARLQNNFYLQLSFYFVFMFVFLCMLVFVFVFLCVSVFVFACFPLVFVKTGGVCIGDWMFDEGTPSLA